MTASRLNALLQEQPRNLEIWESPDAARQVAANVLKSQKVPVLSGSAIAAGHKPRGGSDPNGGCGPKWWSTGGSQGPPEEIKRKV